MTAARRSGLVALGMLAALAGGCASLPQQGEQLQLGVPEGYRVVHQDTRGPIYTTEMVPNGQSSEDWLEMLTTQLYAGLKSVSPAEFRAESQRKWLTNCREGSYTEVMTGDENGYPVAVWMLSCPYSRAPGRPEHTWFKAIRGGESLYVVQKAFRFEPSPEQSRLWMRTLRQATMCAPGKPARPLP